MPSIRLLTLIPALILGGVLTGCAELGGTAAGGTTPGTTTSGTTTPGTATPGSVNPGPTTPSPSTPPTVRQRLEAAAVRSGVKALVIAPRADGGLNVSGTLNGLPFAVRVPPKWNDQSVLEAHGYVYPQSAEAVPDPSADPSFGLLSAAYAQGYAAANTAYGKTGYAVKSGVEANKRLHDFLAAAGSTKQYITGLSMGGNIAVALAEQYPADWVGVLPYCGVVAGWAAEQRYLVDFRVVYDYFTRGTPYALPGNGQANVVNAALTVDGVRAKVLQLFTAAAQGDRAAQAILGQVVSVLNRTLDPAAPISADPVTFITPLASSVYGLADELATTGGTGYSNVGKVYAGSGDDAALNAGVERMALSANDPSGGYLAANYTPTGHFAAKMLSFHNTSDPLVPYTFEPEYRRRVEQAGNSANLVQQTVRPKPVTNTADTGPAHCYFSPREVVGAWNELRTWVDSGVRPVDGQDITSKP